jgi:6-phosphogluconate dehydrogenase
MGKEGCDIGLIGLGVMGRNFVLNMADRGFSVAVYNRTTEKTETFMKEEVGGRDIRAGYSLEEFVGNLRRPRAAIIMVSAGKAVDAVIDELLPLLDSGDVVIDSGNSHFPDTDRRGASLEEKGMLYLGMGISGGELGARHGPSLMPGGPKEGYERVEPILKAAAAHVNGEACVTYLGPASAGHYVKMVHNGIEYGLEQLIAETYDLMKRGLGLNNDELHEVYARWNREELASYLIEITAAIFTRVDEETGKRLVDVILDIARQKGTGIWTSQDAMDLRVPVPTIDIAVSMRCLSEIKDQRKSASQFMPGPEIQVEDRKEDFVRKLKNGLYAATIVTYAQGLSLLRRASDSRKYNLNMEAVARIWRGGCIIRAALLEDLRDAFQEKPDLPNLLLDPRLGRDVLSRLPDWRTVVSKAAEWGIPTPGLMVSLAYFDAYRSERLPANLTQAQRDYFGAHTYERVDAEGTFHTEWNQDQEDL